MTNHERLYAMTFAYLYPMYVDKAEKKGRTQDEVDTIIMWLFGYTPAKLKKAIEDAFQLSAQPGQLGIPVGEQVGLGHRLKLRPIHRYR